MVYHHITIIDIVKLFGGTLALYLLYQRFKTTDDIKKNQVEQFHLNNRYNNFLETSKLLTNKDSTIEAKISGMYLLYDYAIKYPEEIEKVYQLLNEYVKPLLRCIDNDCATEKYKMVKIFQERNSYLDKKEIYEYTENKTLNIDVYSDENIIETVTKWQITGTKVQKEVSITLIILRDLSATILQKSKIHIDLSNTIIFNLDKKFYKKLKFKSLEKPTYNLVFLNCNLKNVNFMGSKFYYCKFINCDLDNANFKKCELNYTKFYNCDLNNSKFQEVNLETIIFDRCNNEPS